LIVLCTLALVACNNGIVKRVSEPAASLQQLTVRADGNWTVALRLQNFSSMPMTFDDVSLALTVGDSDAGTLQAKPGISIGGTSGRRHQCRPRAQLGRTPGGGRRAGQQPHPGLWPEGNGGGHAAGKEAAQLRHQQPQHLNQAPACRRAALTPSPRRPAPLPCPDQIETYR
jgi:hypothetical protein